MPKTNRIKSVLVIGSGPIVIGQAAEFDYAGTQGCIALREEGYRVILVNSNPATIMTDKEMADIIYIEPLTLDSVSKIIEKERPDAILATLGGQVGLNLVVELSESGVLQKHDVELIGTGLDSILRAENRESFRSLMLEINEPIPESKTVSSSEEACEFAEAIGFPVIVRPAFTLGGTGGGICRDVHELIDIVNVGLSTSPAGQCLIELSISGYKEIEYEIIRDANDTAIVVCNMENVDPLGVHTGDSIVVAPSQTLTDKEHQMLRNSALKIVRALEIEGGCNVQFALDPWSNKYYVIEVNPRVSRSSALASKATGYPIAKVATKVAVGMTLDEIINPVTQKTFVSFEPALDYVVTKMPRFPFDKFPNCDTSLGTQMKSTGEVMAIGRNFEESIQKAIRSLEISKANPDTTNNLEYKIRTANDERIFCIFEAIRKGFTLDTIYSWCKIDLFFLRKFKNIVQVEKELVLNFKDIEVLKKAKEIGFSDLLISELWGLTEEAVRELRKDNGIIPTYKMVDTCAAEFEAETPYYYSTYEDENESKRSSKESIIVIGSGPIRIGQGIEFDYSTVHAVRAIQEAGYEAIVVNNNPETVSTDYSFSDKLYFEPLTLEDVLNIVDLEVPKGVVVQFGGQTAINLAEGLSACGVNIIGTQVKGIDLAEDRDSFYKILSDLNISMPPYETVTGGDKAMEAAEKICYPVIVRPSYVLGGRGMEVVQTSEQMHEYLQENRFASRLLIDKYLEGQELEVDAIFDGENIFIPGIMEHIERAGVHSGDSISVYPANSISDEIKSEIARLTEVIARGLCVIGLINIQFVVFEGEIFVLEANTRSSRSVPFLSKATNLPIAKMAMEVILGNKLANVGVHPECEKTHVKVPVFSFAKLAGANQVLGPEMKSTGEVMASDTVFEIALGKAFSAAGTNVPLSGRVLIDVEGSQLEILKSLFEEIDYEVVLPSKSTKDIDLAVSNVKSSDKLRFELASLGVPCLTSIDTAKSIVEIIKFTK